MLKLGAVSSGEGVMAFPTWARLQALQLAIRALTVGPA